MNIASLPGSCFPLPDELLSSWVSRIALNHSMSPIKLWQLLTPDNYFKNKRLANLRDIYYDMDQNWLPTVLDKLVEYTTANQERVAATTLAEYQPFLLSGKKGNTSQKYQWLLNFGGTKHRSLYTNRLVFCSRCLQKDGSQPYWRKTWRFSLTVACLDCGLLLNDCCRMCGSGVDYRQLYTPIRFRPVPKVDYLKLSNCQYCDLDLSTARVRLATSVILEQQRTLQTLIQKNYQSPDTTTQLYFRALRHVISSLIILTLNTYINKESVPFLLKNDSRLQTYLDHRHEKFAKTFEYWPIDLRRRFLYQAMIILQKGPEQYTDELKYHSVSLKTQYELLSQPHPALLKKIFISQSKNLIDDWSKMDLI